ncbi:MAG: FtsW/RodA/SpoVE family cell cycle protein [Saprospiraceae bacterium]|nr:FtsW/RodA/SpoVE family cell cycle protein [Saprospiraceae bacterium]MBK9220926.1 FtsW/RodA/SpoVE family cell cycle protein [Saprospiraceae bacterium]MBK9722229.1 FtsW/RodA/SpoVE family cell cycle protein [Saprospiraceae bacterium]MBK9729250.1 FtsW/RodA/SpoVE family cell cycle protein [Saprospiraceae bacterium]
MTLNIIKDKILSPNFIWTLIFLLVGISLVAVYSASGSLTKYDADNTSYFLGRHVSFVLIGLTLIWIFSKIDYTLFNRWAPAMLVVSIFFLILTFFFGVNVNDARRWLNIPILNLTFQVSDFAKLALILYLARSISEKQDVIKGFKSAFIPIMLPILIVCGLIAPSNLSTAAVLFLGCVIMMFVGRIDMKYILMLVGLGILLLICLVYLENLFPGLTRAETWMSRINKFRYGTEEEYQLEQAKMAIANGHWFIPSPGNSMLRNFIPYSYADFIYPIICEEYGLILGGFGVILLYLALLVHCVGIVSNTTRAFGALLTIGIGINMVMQAFSNIAVALGLVPVTGLPLPFISMGGTSLIFTSISLGMIISVSRHISNLKLELEPNEEMDSESIDIHNSKLANEAFN